jgi:hypothetical protein
MSVRLKSTANILILRKEKIIVAKKKFFIQLDPYFGNTGFGKIRFWQPICKAPAAPMTNIMLKCSDYGNKGLGKTPFLAIYSQSTHSFTNVLILAKKN